MLTGKKLSVGQVNAITSHRVIHFQAIFLAYNKVILAMAGGSVYSPGAGLCGDVRPPDTSAPSPS